jgi:phytoene/squalene synthetase
MDYRQDWLKQNPEAFLFPAWALPPIARAPVAAFYAFVQGIGRIAGDVKALHATRQRELKALERSLSENIDELAKFARDFGRLIRKNPQLLPWARDVLSAYVQDTLKPRYHDYHDLLDYAQRAAAPMGRTALLLCGEKKADIAACDALYNALQILHYVQNCADDYVNRNRVYLPLDWFAFAGTDVKILAASDNCSALLIKARTLPKSIGRFRMRLQVAKMHKQGEHLCCLLRKHDPLAAKVRLSFYAKLGCFVRAFFAAI